MNSLLKHFIHFFIFIGIALFSSLTYALPILAIIPSITNISVRTDGVTFVTYTVTNNTTARINNMSVFPTYHTSGNPAEIALQNNLCATANLAPGASCLFQVVIQGQKQPATFEITPRVCAYHNTVCSQPTANYRLQVTTNATSNPATAYIAMTSGPNNNSLLPIALSTNSLGSYLPGFSFGVQGVGVSVNGAGKKVYVANQATNLLNIVDVSGTPTITGSITVGNKPIGVVLTPNNAKMYVSNRDDNSISVIDVASSTVIATIAGGTGPYGNAVSPDGAHVYVANFFANTVSVIATNSDTVIATIPVGASPTTVAISPDNARAYVNNFSSNNISVINLANNQIIATVNVGTGPAGIAINPNGTRIYVANNTSGTISVIDTISLSVIATIPVGTGPAGLAMHPDGSVLVATLTGENYISLINTSTLGVTNINVGGNQRPLNYFVG